MARRGTGRMARVRGQGTNKELVPLHGGATGKQRVFDRSKHTCPDSLDVLGPSNTKRQGQGECV